jgi:RNA polymerase sigma-70 factor (ECF subfamily)
MPAQAACPNERGREQECDRAAPAPLADAEAFIALYDRLLPRIYRYAYRRLGTHADAEDIAAQTFQRALEFRERYQQRGVPVEAWLFRIAHNLIVDHYRARRDVAPLDACSRGIAADAEPLDMRVLENERLSTVWEAVASLPPLQRRAVTLYFGHDLPHAEVGRRIGRSEAATKQLVYRAMRALRMRLVEVEGGVGDD